MIFRNHGKQKIKKSNFFEHHKFLNLANTKGLKKE